MTKILVIFILAHLTHHLCTAILIPLLPLIRDAFVLNYYQSGWLITSFSLSYGFGQLPMAGLADKVSKRALLAIGMIMVSLCTIAIGVTTKYYQLITLLILMGLLGATYHPAASSLLSQHTDENKRGKYFGWHIWGGSAGFLIAPPIAGLIIKQYDWRIAYIAFALPALVVGVLFYLIVRKSGTHFQKGRKLWNISWYEFSSIIKKIGILVSISIISHMITAGANSFISLYLVDRHNLSPSLAAIFVGMITGAGVIGAPIGGALSDAFGRKPIIMLSVILAGPLLFLFTVLPYGLLLILTIIIYGATGMFKNPTIESLIADVVPWDKRASILGIYYFLNMETASIIAPVIGKIIDNYGLFNTYIILSLITCIISMITVIFRKKLLGRSDH